MKRRTEKKRASRYMEDRSRERRRERGHHWRWQLVALLRTVYRSIVAHGITAPPPRLRIDPKWEQP